MPELITDLQRDLHEFDYQCSGKLFCELFCTRSFFHIGTGVCLTKFS